METQLIYLFALFIAFVILSTFMISTINHINKSTKRQSTPKSAHSQSTPPTPKRNPTKCTPDELMHVLDFMLSMNVIDTKEYNQLLVKASPYIK